ncbi:sulfite exporter TauE/SafE family protein [Pseudoduganella sp. LjRoot289]|uniref:sulfite exporter TauE/SafE family protein n=1 Tax=Pseudoduganella sp. LjRoot289 TaxID=3342314 RepID=UPI003ECF91AC
MLTGISKGGFGSAFGGISVPLMALAISPAQAAAILLPVLCFMDLVGFRVYYGKWDVANLKIMVPGAIAGVAIGALTFGTIPEAHIRIVIGAIAVLFTLNQWLNFASRQAPASRSATKGVFWAGISGFTSFLAHAGGPPAQVYMLPQRLDKTTYVATVSLFFMIVNMVKLIPYAWLGQFSSANLWTALLLAPLVPVGVKIGLWLQAQASPKWFYRIAQICLLLTGLQLIYQGMLR